MGRPKSSQVIVKLDQNGFPDRSFGRGGAFRAKGLSPARSILASPTTVFSVSRKFIDGTRPRNERSQIKVAAVSRNGDLNRRFGDDGVMTIDGWEPSFRPGGAALNSRGLPVILASREVKSSVGLHQSSRLIAITGRGEIDRDFGRFGTFEDPPFPFAGSELVKTTRGNFVVLARRIPGYTPVLLSYRADGTLDDDFGERGVVEFDGYAEKLAALAGGQVAILSTEGLLTKFDRYGEVLDQNGPIPTRSRAAIAGDGYGVVTTGWSRLDPSEHPYVRGFGPDLYPQPQLEANSRTGETMEHEYWAGYEQLISLPDRGLISLDRATPTMQFALTRMGRDGLPDPEFGTDGRLVIEEESFGSAVSLLPGPGSSALLVGPDYRSGRSVTMLNVSSDGDRHSTALKGFRRFYFSDATVAGDGVLVAGSVDLRPDPRKPSHQSFRVARYGFDGNLDRSFGRGGFTDVNLGFPIGPDVIARDRRGRILVAGWRCGRLPTCRPAEGSKALISLIRLSPDGKLDRNFGTDGKVTLRSTSRKGIQGMSALNDGRIVLWFYPGCARTCARSQQMLMLRTDGQPDRRVGRSGNWEFRAGSGVAITNVTPAGRSGMLVSGTLRVCEADPQFSLAKLGAYGKRVRAFGGGDGVLLSPVSTGRFGAIASSSARQDASTMTFAGLSFLRGGEGGVVQNSGLARFNLSAKDRVNVDRRCGS
ncbi:MAG: hypothetical protein KDB57_03740 [Solirubrobacterales bacterium]|nr:hypothetical protein [Solirubrobacterales bacterium]